MKTRRISAVAVAVAALASLSGCTAPAATPESVLTVSDVWIRAVPDLAEGDMTGMFMTIENSGDETVYLQSGTTDGTYTSDGLDAHEVVMDDSGEMVMQEAAGGIPVPAHGSVQLMPGGYHVMFWNLTKPIAVGDDVHASLEFSNGETVEVHAVAMTLDGGTEKYVPNDGK
jgi:copper(I)-binding protein